MNRQKAIELARKNNSKLQKEFNNLKFKLEYDQKLNREGLKKAKDLIFELEQTKAKWLKSLNELNEERERYHELSNDLQKMRNEMIAKGYNKVPWYKKLFQRKK